MNKYTVSLLLIILLFNCSSPGRKDLNIEFDKSTIFIDENKRNGEVILEGLRFSDTLSSQQLKNSYEYLLDLTEKKLLSSEVFGMKLYNTKEESIVKKNEKINMKLVFSYSIDPSFIINEIYTKILKIDCKSYYSEEYETVLVTYFSSDNDIVLNSYGSEHISINEETFNYKSTKYITAWDKTKGPYKVHLSEVFRNNDYQNLLDAVGSASQEE